METVVYRLKSLQPETQKPQFESDMMERLPNSDADSGHTNCARFRAQFKQAFIDFVSAYKEAYTQLSRSHFKNVFPEGAIPPTAWAT